MESVRNQAIVVVPEYIERMTNTRRRVIEPVPLQPINETTPRWPVRARLHGGGLRWGSFDAVVGQYGVRRYRLTIYPPGTGINDRFAARLWRGWPIGGAALIVLAEMLLGDVLASAGTVLATAAAVYVGTGAVLLVRGGPARVPVRSMTVVVMPKSVDVQELCRYTYWRALVDILTDADHRLACGDICAVQHEAIWWEAYDRLGEWSRPSAASLG